jgi:CDP-4-dehydro-6-deoxyglucose reductase
MALDAMLRVMSAHVTVKPSGSEFFVEGSETLLKAALRAGLAPNYGCGNGNCGLCKARVVGGETRMVAPSDYRFSDVEKAQGHVLMCACTAVSSDLVLEMLEADAPDDIPEQRLMAKVRSVDALDDEVLRLHLQTPRTNRMRFLAGQRVTLGLANSEGGGGDCHGEYAIASCPCDDRNLIFHIRRVASADFSNRLSTGSIKAGTDISVWGPWGSFVLDKDTVRPLIFVAIDTGFAPINSLIEHAIAVEVNEPMTLYWAATRPDGQYFSNQCRAWLDAFDNFRYQPLMADQLQQALLADPLLMRSDVYLAGEGDSVAVIAAALIAAGLPAAQLRVETI